MNNITCNKFVDMLLAGVVFVLLALAYSPTAQADDPPDEGLFTDAGDIRGLGVPDDPTIIRARFVNVNFDLLGDVKKADAPPGQVSGVSEQLNLNLFDDVNFTAILEQAKANWTGSCSWIGHLDGVECGDVVLVFREGIMTGTIITPGGVYEVRPVGGDVHAIYQIDQSAFPPEAEPTPVDVSDKVLAETDVTIMADDGSQIDVLVVYTDDARLAEGGTAQIEDLITDAGDLTNTGYDNSNITQRIRLVHMEEVAYIESGDLATDVNRLQGTADGHMDNVHSLRDYYWADVVVLIVDNGGDFCGRAYDIMSPVSDSFENKAFCVVVRSCATGNLSFGHELGHLMSARHDWYVDATDNSPYTYNHGYVNTTDNWRTVMAYNDWCDCSDEASPCPDDGSRATPGSPSCTRLVYWSNPGLTYGGDPMGVAGGSSTSCTAGSYDPDPGTCDADNHLTLNNTAYTVANFRVGRNPVYVAWYATPPFDGSSTHPFATVTEGVNAVRIGGTVWIVGPHNYNETLTINKAMTLRSTDGTVAIGAP